MIRRIPPCALLLAVLVGPGWAVPDGAGAQPSASAEATVVLPGSPAAAGRAGTTLVFGNGPFDAIDQPAHLGAAAEIVVEAAWQIDRFADPDADPWAVGVVFPLGDAASGRPAVTVSHRRLQGADLAVPGFDRLRYDVDHDLTTIGLGRRLAGGRLAWGAAVHAVSKSGVSRLTLRRAVGDTTVAPAGADDLLVAFSAGLVGSAAPRDVSGGSLSLRSGLALRRWGEDVELESAGVRTVTGATVGLARRSALGADVAWGAGAEWTGSRARLRGAFDLAWPVHDGADGSTILAAGLSATWLERVTLRAGVRDDERGTDTSFGLGLVGPAWRGARLTIDLAREPVRSDLSSADAAFVVGFALRFDPAAAAPADEDDLDDLFDDLDRLDDWIDDSGSSTDPSSPRKDLP